MLLQILLAFSIFGADMRPAPLQAAQDWRVPDLILPSPAIGKVPPLAPSPDGLPLAETRPGGTWLPYPRDLYVAAQVSALYRYPTLAQATVDAAIRSEHDICLLQLMDLGMVQPTWLDRVRRDMGWFVGGIVLGGAAVAALAFR